MSVSTTILLGVGWSLYGERLKASLEGKVLSHWIPAEPGYRDDVPGMDLQGESANFMKPPAVSLDLLQTSPP